ncbi:acyltransferase family protein [Actinacidiphila acidipaludis]|uniref:Acyltransferase n=1 Tax=Actinacidiphila acidipaludis TaxID=2873382 RepID=A0ABS7Q2B9_9ACTN|nr:acyltransferase [Streptomyces acidipaludis]MBY8877270.1 acyltransferase [Streptomyces acidipaludis]
MSVSPPISRRERLPSLTGLRAVAALMVFAFHIYAVAVFASPGVNRWMSHSASQGGVGVTFFFLLSGFLLTWTARGNDTARRFWRRRAVKIVPNHLVTWVAAFVFLSISGLTLTGSFDQFGLDSLPNLFLLGDWFPRGGVFFSMNIPSWSLGCEAFFYLSFPLLLPLARRIGARMLWPAAVALVALVWLMPVIADAAFHQGPPVPGLPVSEDRMWFVYTLPPVRMLEFLLGIVLALIVEAGRWPRIGLRTASVLSLAGYVGSSYLPYLFGLVAGALVPLALLIPTAAVADIEGRPSPWRGPVAVWLGNVSFAFYMVHQLVIRWVHYALGATRSWDTPQALGVTALMFTVALALATLLYYAVELPLVRLFSQARTSSAAQPATPATAPPQPASIA